MPVTKKPAALLGAALALTLSFSAVSAGPASAQSVPAGPVPYINPDTDKPTANPDVDANSGCGDDAGESPDTADTQPVVTDPKTDNVHTDGCIFDAAGTRTDVQAAYEVSGVGTISACPDPDGMDVAGMEADDKSATLSNGDTLCVLSGYEDANEEYHVRTISNVAGTQTVTLCADPEGNGCADADATSATTVTWTADDGMPQGGVDTGLAQVNQPSTSPAWTSALFAAAGLLGGAALISWRLARRASA